MNSARNELWKMLVHAGVVSGELPSADSIESPWYIKALLAISGWLAALFLLGFIGAAFSFAFRNSGVSFVVGGLMIGGAYAFLRMPKNEFIEHLALAVSFAGQCLVAYAIYDSIKGEAGIFLIAVFQLGLAVVMPNFLHRVFSSFAFAFFLSHAFTGWGLPYVVSGLILCSAAWLWLNEFRFSRYTNMFQPIGYGLILAVVSITCTALMSSDFSLSHNKTLYIQPWMGEVIAGVALLYVVWEIVNRIGHGGLNKVSLVLYGAVVALTLVSWQAHGITVGLVILLLGFAGSNRVLMGLGIIAFLYFVSSYYYFLEVTLLIKSLSLLLIGLVMLGVRWLLIHFTSTVEEA